jgi:serine protease Do
MMTAFDRDSDDPVPESGPLMSASSSPPAQWSSDAGQSRPDRPVDLGGPVRGGGGDRLAWLLSTVAFLLLLSFFLPYTVEKMTYAVARGRQRAMYETAGEQLRQVGLHDLSKAYQLVANRVGPSVVHINVTSSSVEAAASLLGGPVGGPEWQHPATGQGSGVIVDPEGYVVTNEHVVRGSSRIRVRLSDGRNVPATIVGTDRPTDMAVLKLSADGLIAAEWGDSDQLQLGALVWALGSPLGLQQSVTFGILSGKHRSFRTDPGSGMYGPRGMTADSPYHDFLQTDAAVNPGNSGGPLIDCHGKVVGINTAIVGEAYQGISFAIPSRVARPIYERIRREGRVTRGWLGVDPQDVSVEIGRRLGLEQAEGALVIRVVPNPDGSPSPAQQAGLQAEDVIVGWDGKPVRSRTELFSHVALTPVGSTVDVVILRHGARITVNVTVVERPIDEGP